MHLEHVHATHNTDTSHTHTHVYTYIQRQTDTPSPDVVCISEGKPPPFSDSVLHRFWSFTPLSLLLPDITEGEGEGGRERGGGEGRERGGGRNKTVTTVGLQSLNLSTVLNLEEAKVVLPVPMASYIATLTGETATRL